MAAAALTRGCSITLSTDGGGGGDVSAAPAALAIAAVVACPGAAAFKTRVDVGSWFTGCGAISCEL